MLKISLKRISKNHHFCQLNQTSSTLKCSEFSVVPNKIKVIDRKKLICLSDERSKLFDCGKSFDSMIEKFKDLLYDE